MSENNPAFQREWFVKCLANHSLVEKLKNISLIIADVDGCLTPARKSFSESGDVSKMFCMHDGAGIGMTRDRGIHVAFVTGDKSPIITTRAKYLGIPDELCHRVEWLEKAPTVKKIQSNLNLTPEHTLILGDDVAEVIIKDLCSILAVPCNAPFYICAQADIVTSRPGGSGALRCLIDLLLYVQEKHPFQNLIAHAL